ncbi:MAG: VOC family protein [Shewanella sp.]|nr:VOC family protein [Shewanella sp.]
MQVTQYLQGFPCWIELAATDARQAKAFYTSLFGWTLTDIPLPEGAYTMYSVDAQNQGAIYAVTEQMDFVVPGWNIYFAVTDINKTLQQIRKAGGLVRTGPHQLGVAGHMAMVSDVEGASFCLWQAGNHSGAASFGELNTLCWVELACRNPVQALEFYQQSLGWQSRRLEVEGHVYTELEKDSLAFGGMLQMTDEWDDINSHWMPYFRVEDVDLTVARAQELGGEICMPTTEIGGVGRFAVLNDPQGAAFSVISLNN